MIRWRRLLSLLPALATLAVLLTGNAQAVLLDVGPTVPPVVGSTPPTLGHGFPLWYRDFNRVPLELCTNEAMCLFVRPDPTQPVTFPTNMPDEVFFYSADTSVATPAGTADFISGVEGNILTTADGSLELISFARVRIRVDTNVAGTYTVTTPWKVYVFDNVPVGLRGINFTEDIGIGPNGHFEGALAGTIGPFLYCTNAPIPATDGTGGLYLGDPVTPCQVLGSTFPSAQNPTNFFRVEGPAGFGTVTTNTFTITGKIYDADPVPTPLTVDRVTYSRNTQGMQYSAFATTQALSNQTVPTAPFPQNFALTGALSALEVAGTDIPTLPMTTNNPEDGKFFATSGVVTDPGTLPATVTVTNTSDVPITTKDSPLVDEIVISEAVYTPTTGILNVVAASGDLVTPPTLELFFPGEVIPAGTIVGGQLSVTFPLDIGGKNYAIPPPNVTVVSSLGGTSSAAVQVSMPAPAPPASGVTLTPNISSPQTQGTSVTFIAAGSGGSGSYEYRFLLFDGSSWNIVQGYATTDNWTWSGALPGNYLVAVEVRNAGSTSDRESFTQMAYNIPAPVAAVTGVNLFQDKFSPQLADTSITFSATATGGTGSYEYRYQLFNGSNWSVVQPYSSTPTWTWTPALSGTYAIAVDARNTGSTTDSEAQKTLVYVISSPTPATGVNLFHDLDSPQTAGTPISFAAAGIGGTGSYEYQFLVFDGNAWTVTRPFSTVATWSWTPTLAGSYLIAVEVRNAGSTVPRDAVSSNLSFTIN